MTRSEQGSGPATYDADFFTWTQEQAAALRMTRDVVVGSVDVEHVADEIEDLASATCGRSARSWRGSSSTS